MSKFQASQFAAMNCAYQSYPFEDCLDSIAKLGFQTLELWGGFPHQFILDRSYPQNAAVRGTMESRGLSLCCYTPEQIMYPYNNIADRDADVRRISLDYFKKCIAATPELGSDKMLITPGKGYCTETVEEIHKRSRESLRELGEYAKTQGVILMLENLQPAESQVIHSLAQHKRMWEEIGLDNVKPMVDTVAMHLAGDTMQDYLDTFGEALVHVHLVDGEPIGHRALGRGDLPWQKDLDALANAGYRGAMTFEIFYLPDGSSPEEEMRRSWNAVQAYIG